VILIWGSADDPPVERLVSILRDRSVDLVHIDENVLAKLRYDVTLGAIPTGWIETQDCTVRVDELTGIYVRPGESLPELTTEASMTLLGIVSCAPAIVVNRPSAGRSNWSKPFQLRLIAAAGLQVPDTLVTTDPEAALSFLVEHKRVVYKSISGIRSIVATLTSADAERLHAVAHGPVQFQQWIDGQDVRVHVVGHRWFATAIDSDVDDYRYASRNGTDVTMTPIEIPSELGKSLVALTQRMGLLVSGIDLRVTENGEWFCFEVNPSPGFTFYEAATGQPIADAIADLLESGPKSKQRRRQRTN
jgi:glutathione synthase/RimK-type ligase-like ATP-grasp enzyme